MDKDKIDKRFDEVFAEADLEEVGVVEELTVGKSGGLVVKYKNKDGKETVVDVVEENKKIKWRDRHKGSPKKQRTWKGGTYGRFE
uniref:Uncharacterized protein n=1 Tax=viral metagenome TaxID=1070528 RepID=A0A6M3KAB0_9ZZZZ